MINRVRDWVTTKLGLPSDEPLPAASNYMTLVPLSDARLQPRRTKLLVSVLVCTWYCLRVLLLPKTVHRRWCWACWQ